MIARRIHDPLRVMHSPLCKCPQCECISGYNKVTESMNFRIAAYGTLMLGQFNHDILKDSHIIGSGWIEGFALAKCGRFPAAFECENARIWAEIYSVSPDVLAECDSLEGIDTGYYKRIATATHFGKAFIYIQSTVNIQKDTVWYPSGIWRGSNTATATWRGWTEEQKYLLAVKAAYKDALKVGSHDDYNPAPRQQSISRDEDDDLSDYERYWLAKGAAYEAERMGPHKPTVSERCTMIRRAMANYDEKLKPEEL